MPFWLKNKAQILSKEHVKLIITFSENIPMYGFKKKYCYILQEDHSPGQNPDFLKLIALRKEVAEILGTEEHSLELSMGMSNDFEEAIK